MKDAGGRVIYVGKSRSLRDRVSQYFHGEHPVKTARMAGNVRDFDFITCDTEMEALALENRLIKQYQPRYNIRLKDAKSYPYIRLDLKESYPRPSMTRTRRNDSALYFGPYSGTATVYAILNTLEKTLGIPNCNRKFPEDIGKARPCLYRQTGRCIGVCAGDVSEEEYRRMIERAADLLRGNTSSAIRDAEQRMERCAEDLQFEEAARLRDSIAAMKKLGEKQKTVGAPGFECDVIGLSVSSGRQCAAVFYIRNGYIADSEHLLFDDEEILDYGALYAEDGEGSGDEESPLTSFLVSFYQKREFIPREVLLSFPLQKTDTEVLSAYLTAQAGYRVTVRHPERGQMRRLCEMAADDARRHGENEQRGLDSREKVLVALARALQLEVLPERIESYDISSYGSECMTAGMVVAEGGKLKKSEYRFFRIQWQEGQDDYAAMREAVIRRMSHLSDADGSFSRRPDLLLLDGGKGHVAVIRRTLEEMGLDIPVFGMVKDEHHKTRTLCSDTAEISVARDQTLFRFLYGLQEEVHRYTVSRMDSRKRKTLRTSTLEKIPGIGPAKAAALLKAFGTLKAVREADEAQLAAVRGISRTDAARIAAAFAGEQTHDEETTTT